MENLIWDRFHQYIKQKIMVTVLFLIQNVQLYYFTIKRPLKKIHFKTNCNRKSSIY